MLQTGARKNPSRGDTGMYCPHARKTLPWPPFIQNKNNFVLSNELPPLLLATSPYTAAAPEMISISSLVITACLVLLYVKVNLSIMSPGGKNTTTAH